MSDGSPSEAAEAVGALEAGVKTNEMNPSDNSSQLAGLAEAVVANRGVTDPNKARDCLAVLARLLRERPGKEIPMAQKMHDETERLIRSVKKENVALGYDFKIAQLQADQVLIEEKIKQLNQAKTRPDIKPEQAKVIDEEIKRLEERLNGTKNDQGETVTKGLRDQIADLQKERQNKAPDEPNQITILAAKLGVDTNNPLSGIFNKLQKKPKDPKAYYQELKNKGFSEKEIKLITDCGRLIRGEKKPRWKEVIRGVGIIGALLLIFMWAASKAKGQGGGGMD